MKGGKSIVLLLFIVTLSGLNPAESTGKFTFVNSCKTTIWPAIFPGDSFNGGGFPLQPGQSMVFQAPPNWSGRIWARTGCSFNPSSNTGPCETASCGSLLQCTASGATPATLAEFTTASDRDFYDVSLVDGFNLPVVITPLGGTGPNCSVAGCDGDLRDTCPDELAVKVGGRVVACRSACDVFGTDEYCCKGKFGNSATCLPTGYSKGFKRACPTAYSYAYDDPSSIFICSRPDYIIGFCGNRQQSVCSSDSRDLKCSGSNRLSASMLLFFLFCILTFLLLI